MLVEYIVKKMIFCHWAVLWLAGDTGTMQWKSAGSMAKLVIILSTDTLPYSTTTLDSHVSYCLGGNNSLLSAFQLEMWTPFFKNLRISSSQVLRLKIQFISPFAFLCVKTSEKKRWRDDFSNLNIPTPPWMKILLFWNATCLLSSCFENLSLLHHHILMPCLQDNKNMQNQVFLKVYCELLIFYLQHMWDYRILGAC